MQRVFTPGAICAVRLYTAMKSVWSCLFLALILGGLRLLFFLAQPWGDLGHAACIDWQPNPVPGADILKALSCGKRLSYESALLFKRLGLVHLMVVSGAHLSLVENLFHAPFKGAGRTKQVVSLLAVGVFVMISGSHPPVIRAGAYCAISLLNHRFRLRLKPFHISFCSVLICLVFAPYWIHSLSFALSSLASLLLHCQSGRRSLLTQCTLMYIGLAPLVAFLGLPHFSSILVNWFFLPAFGTVLFPFSVLAYIVTPLTPYASQVWLWVQQCLEPFAIETSPSLKLAPKFWPLIWAYILLGTMVLRSSFAKLAHIKRRLHLPLFVFALIFLQHQNLQPSTITPHILAVWDVGQGQWVTYVHKQHCYHFDMGGEYMPGPRLAQLCKNKHNLAFFSHSDYDHIGLVRKARYTLNNLCLGHDEALKFASKIPLQPCHKTSKPFVSSRPGQGYIKDNNSSSEVFYINSIQSLLPGDSPHSMHKLLWPKTDQAKRLVLSHHGSHTGTGEALLRSMPRLELGIASSRTKVYGHPHRRSAQIMWQHQVPLVSTNDWGDIFLQF